MTEDFNAGRLYLDAYIDTSGAARGLQQRINAQTKAVRAKIKAEIDSRGAAAQARAAAKEASGKVRLQAQVDSRGTIAAARSAATGAANAAKVRMRAELDSRGLVTAAREAAKAASVGAVVKIRAELDQGSLAQVRAGIAAASQGGTANIGVRGGTAEVDVDADTAGAEAEIEGMRQAQEGRPIDIPIRVNTSPLSALGTAVAQASRLPALVGGFYALGTAIVQVGGGLVAMASAAAQASSVLAAIPNLLGIAAQGIGVLIAGFSGVGEAVKQMGAAQQASAGQSSRAAAGAQRDAGAIKAAQDSLADAHRQVTRAKIAERDAQQDLNRAYAEARENLRDLRDQLRAARNDEEEAVDQVAAAKMRLQDVEWNPAASPQERAEAEADLREANNALEEARDRRKDLADDNARAQKAGVKGDQGVIAAQRRLRDARLGVADANRGVAQAERALAAAQRGTAAAAIPATAAAVNLQQAMDNLSPAGQRFAKFVYDVLRPRMQQMKFAIQEALLPPLQRGITAALPLLDTLEVGLVGTATRVGALGERLGNLFGRKTFNDDVATIMASNNRAIGQFSGTAVNLVKILRDLAVVAGPTLVEPFARWTRVLTKNWAEQINAARESGGLARFLERAADRAAQLGDIIRNTAKGLYGLGRAAIKGAGDDLLGSLEKVTEKFATFANSEAGQKRMQDFFEATKPVTEEFGRLVISLGEFLIKAGEANSGPLVGLMATLRGILEAFNFILSVPGLGPVVSGLLTMAGVAGALGLVAGGILKIGGNLRKIGKVTGLSKLTSAIKGSTDAIDDELPKDKAKGEALDDLGGKADKSGKSLRQKFTGAVKAATGAVVRGTKAVGRYAASLGRAAAGGIAKAARGLGNVARSAAASAATMGRAAAGGIAKAATGMANLARTAAAAALNMARLAIAQGRAAIAAGVHAARLVLQRVVTIAISAATRAWAIAQALLNAAMRLNPIGIIITVLVALGAALVLAYKKSETFRRIVNGAWAAIKSGLSALWKFVRPVFSAWMAYIRTLGKVAMWLWRNAVMPAWRGIQAAIRVGWAIVKPIFKAFWDGLKTLGGWVKWLWEKGVRPAWNSIKDAISTGWKRGIKPILEAFGDFIRKTVKPAFEKGVKGIKDSWATLKEAAAKPVRFMVNTIYSNGIRKMFNAIPGVSLPAVSANFARGGRYMASGTLPGYTPGRDVHEFYSPTGGRLGLSGGEAIMVPQWAKAIGDRGIAYLNRAARFGKRGLLRATQNLMDPKADIGLFSKGGVYGRAAGAVQRFAKGGRVWPTTFKSLSNDYPGHTGVDISIPGDGDYGKPVFAAHSGTARATYLTDSYGTHIRIAGDDGYETIYGHLSRVIKTGRVQAGETIGAIGSTGRSTGPHLHFEVRPGGTRAAALSWLGGANFQKKGVLAWLAGALKTIKAAVSDIPGWLGNLRNMGRFGPIFRQALGAVGGKITGYINDKVPGPGPIPGGLFDRGGSLMPGATMAYNGTGKIETVFTNENIVRITDNLARMTRSIGETATFDPGKGAAALVENLHITTTPDALPRTLRDAEAQLRHIAMGGLYADRTAQAPVRTAR